MGRGGPAKKRAADAAPSCPIGARSVSKSLKLRALSRVGASRRRAFMRIRGFMFLLSIAATAWSLVGHAQQVLPKVGFLGPASPEPYAHILGAFREGLREVGFTEGENLDIEYRWANDQYERLPTLAAELVQQRVGVIFTASGTQTAQAAQAATSTIPVVFVIGTDPVKFKLVASMNRPGGNVTGVTLLTTSMAQKRLDVLREMIPKATRFALLLNPRNPNFDLLRRCGGCCTQHRARDPCAERQQRGRFREG